MGAFFTLKLGTDRHPLVKVYKVEDTMRSSGLVDLCCFLVGLFHTTSAQLADTLVKPGTCPRQVNALCNPVSVPCREDFMCPDILKCCPVSRRTNCGTACVTPLRVNIKPTQPTGHFTENELRYITVCQGENLDISCGSGHLIYIKDVYYGNSLRHRFSNRCNMGDTTPLCNNRVPNNSGGPCCDVDKSSVTRNICSGRHRCAFNPGRSILYGPAANYQCNYVKLDVSYACVPVEEVYRSCGPAELMTEADGYKYITSQSYPARSEFPPSEVPCSWTIQVPDDKYVQIDFLDFDLVDGAGSRDACSGSNYLVIFMYSAGSHTPWVRDSVLCGKKLPRSKIYPSNVIHIEYYTDVASNRLVRGFWIRYTCSCPVATPCTARPAADSS